MKDEIHNMMYSIASCFHFQPSEIKAMTMGELSFWYAGAVKIHDKEMAIWNGVG